MLAQADRKSGKHLAANILRSRQYLSAAWSDGVEKMAGMLKSADEMADQSAGERAQHLIKTRRLVNTKQELVNRPIKVPGQLLQCGCKCRRAVCAGYAAACSVGHAHTMRIWEDDFGHF